MMVISRQKIDMIIPTYVTAFSARANGVSSVGSIVGDTSCNFISKKTNHCNEISCVCL